MQQLVADNFLVLGVYVYEPESTPTFSKVGITFGGRSILECVVEFHEAFTANFILRHDRRIPDAIKEDLCSN